MSHAVKSFSAKSSAREHFAQRLRSLRVPRGYRTARSFAQALGIDENRYTRYERAEVEPDLGLLQRICELLVITPNELLGHCDPARADPDNPLLATEPASGPSHSDASAIPLLIQTSAWKLACGVAELKCAASPNGTTSSDTEAPLELYRLASPLYAELERRPFDVIRRIIQDPSVVLAPPEKAAKIHQLIEGHISTLHRAAADAWTPDDY